MKRLIVSALAFGPMVAFAQSQPNLSYLTNTLQTIGSLVRTALPIVVGIALLGFFWGLAQFIFAAGDEKKKDAGKRHMIWGVIGLFVMVSVWGLVGFLANVTGVQQGSDARVPSVQGL